MLHFPTSFLRSCQQRVFDWLIRNAISLHRRGETRPDGLRLKKQATCKINLELWARDIHPWDRELRTETRPVQFTKQALRDTGNAITRIFASLPQVEAITVQVFEPGSRNLIITGDVHRSDLTAPRPHSDRMWLNQLGIRFKIIDDRFEALSRTGSSLPVYTEENQLMT